MGRMTAMLALATALIGLGVEGARAEAPQGEPAAPVLFTLDRYTGESAVGVDLANSFDGGDADFDLALRLDLHGRYVTPEGLGGYGHLVVSRVSAEDFKNTATGSFEVGGLWVPQMSLPVVFRAGLAFATADKGIGGFATNLVSGYVTRLTDFALITPDHTWLRLGASPLIRAGSLFVRADAGIDLPITKPDGADRELLLRMNVAAGVMIDKVAVAAELVTVGTTGEADDLADRFLHTAAVSARVELDNLRPGLAVILPLDSDTRDVISFAIMASLVVDLPIGR